MGDRPKRLKRETADRLLAQASGRIRDLNADPRWPWCIDRAVVFGSYVNTDNPRLGDLDIAVAIAPRYTGRTQKNALMTAYNRIAEAHPSLANLGVSPPAVVTIRRTIQAVRGGSKYISVHRIGVDDEAIFSAGFAELDTGTVKWYTDTWFADNWTTDAPEGGA